MLVKVNKKNMEFYDYKISKAQIVEIKTLYAKLGWSLEELEKNLGRSLEDMFWVQGNAIVSGAKLFLPEDYEEVKITL